MAHTIARFLVMLMIFLYSQLNENRTPDKQATKEMAPLISSYSKHHSINLTILDEYFKIPRITNKGACFYNFLWDLHSLIYSTTKIFGGYIRLFM